ncbi:MAG: hypothetical protein WDN31_11495 [Hyphomicrobium sp.]
MNIEKLASLPLEWLERIHSDVTDRQHYLTKNDLGQLPPDLSGFEAFHDARRDRIRKKLMTMLATSVERDEAHLKLAVAAAPGLYFTDEAGE